MTYPEQVLDTLMPVPNDADAITVRDYLVKLLLGLWDEQDGFSGKRPFGNSGWEYDLYRALGQAGYIQWSEDGDVDTAVGDQLIRSAILALGANS